MGEFVNIETGAAPGVATIRIDRPKVNAINAQIVSELDDAASELANSTEVRAVVVWGGPKVFAAGADINGFSGLDRAQGGAFSARITGMLSALEEFRLAADNATFGQPEIQLGIIPGGGGTQRLPRLVGVTRAKEIIYTGRHVKAEEALDIGLVSKVHPADDLYDAALEMAARYAAGPAALQMAKQSVMDGLALPLDQAVAQESEKFGRCFDTEDAHTGVASFIEHGPGKANFTGR